MRVALSSLAIFIFAGVLSAQDLTIISKVTRDGGAPETATSYISSDHLRMSQPEGSETIFDLKSGDMTVLDSRKKTYSIITQKDMDDMAAMIKEQMNSPEMKRAQEQMKNLPPEQQKKMQEMMGGMFAVEVQKSGTSRTIAGYHCDNWSVTIGQFSKSEQCLTTELKLPEQLWQGYKKYYDSMKSTMAAMGPMAKSMESMSEQMRKLKGFPLANTATTTVMGRKSVTTTEVTAINRGPIPASAWQIPAGYKKVDSPMKAKPRKR
jgi:uncharacterized protein DUF4412